MSALVTRMQITKIKVTDATGVEHEFEGEGSIRLYGYGKTVTSIETELGVPDD